MITVENKLICENVSLDFIRWVNKNLVLSNPEYVKKQRMGFWTGKTPRNITLYEMDGDAYILPFGCLREVKDKDTLVIINAHKAHTVEFGGEDIKLYDYQEKAVRALLEAEYGTLQAPAGSGKSIVMTELIKRIGRKALWVTHTHDLLEQSKGYAITYMDNDLIGTITEGKVNIGKGITFATVQTLAKLDLSQYRDTWDVVICDEMHHLAGSPTSVTQFYKVLSSLNAQRKYGMSATVHRSDGLVKAGLSLIGRVVYEITEEDVKDKIIKVGIKPIQTGIQIAESCLNVDGTLNYSSLITYLTENTTRNLIIASSIIESKGHSCLILSDRLSHLETLMSLLPKAMRDEAVMISGKMTSKKGKAEREQAIQDMREGKKKYLFATYSLCKEGVDIPRLDRLMMTTPVKDMAVTVQSIGRIARTHKSKKEAICYDFIDDIGYTQKAYKTRCRHYNKAGCYYV